MGGRKARPARASSADLPPNECPNCGGPLEFEGGLPEGLCATCGIYVELLKAVEAPAKPAPDSPLDRKTIEGAVKKDLEQMSRTHGLKTSGKKGDLTERLNRYVEVRDASVFDAPDSESERAIARRGLLLFLLSLGVSRKAAEAMASLFGSLRAFQRAAQDDLNLLANLSPAEVTRIRDAIAHGETVPPPDLVPPMEEPKPEPAGASERVDPPPPPPIAEALPPPPPVAEAEAQLVLEPPPAIEPERPLETPSLLEPATEPMLVRPSFEPQTEPALVRPALEPDDDHVMIGPGLAERTTTLETVSHEAEAATGSRTRMRRDRWMLYAGTFLQAIGGFGLILGSLLHDVFRIPFLGRNYAAFGSINAVFAVVGVILLMAGLAAIGFSLRGGVARPASATEV